MELILSNWVFRTAILAVVFLIVLFVFWFAINLVTRRLGVKDELRSLQEDGSGMAPQSLAKNQHNSAWSKLVDRLESGGINLDDTKNSEISKTLRAAGYESRNALRVYTLVRLIMIFALPGVYLLFSLILDEIPSATRLYLTSVFLALIGIYLPNLYVRAKADRRRSEIINGFPDSLDLLLVCVEAGLGLEAALDRVSREMLMSHPLISSLFAETVFRMRAGESREEALRKLADAAGVEEIRSFSTLMIQSDKLGTSIATTLRVYASEMRESRKLRAEEKAHRLPVLISIPLVVFMLPTMMGVVALPAIVLAAREVIPAMMGTN